MNLFFEKLVSSTLQIILFSIIPLICWFVTSRKKESFFKWIGLKKITGGKKTWIAIILVAISFILIGLLTLYAIRNVKTATSVFSGLGVRAIPSIIVYAAFNTALPEELFFRGFLLMRLIKILGFKRANIIQSLIFGLLHGFIFRSYLGTITLILIVLFTGIVALFMGKINELYSDGSILPSWIIHTISNLFSGMCSAFLIF